MALSSVVLNMKQWKPWPNTQVCLFGMVLPTFITRPKFWPIFSPCRKISGISKILFLFYTGDGRNNMANSLMIGAAKMGMDFRIVAPESLFPERDLVAYAEQVAASTGGKITLTADVTAGVKDADVIYTDVWASMGEEDKIPERIALLKPYQVNEKMMAATGKAETIFLHCLPAFHNLDTDVSASFPDICEVSDGVFEGDQSRVFDQAENRMHTIKAVMVATLGK
jgi:ornithine carbamoyltransferase